MTEAPDFSDLDRAVERLKKVTTGFSTIAERADAINDVMSALRPFELWHADKSATAILAGFGRAPFQP